jgi:hypothetical protein
MDGEGIGDIMGLGGYKVVKGQMARVVSSDEHSSQGPAPVHSATIWDAPRETPCL